MYKLFLKSKNTRGFTLVELMVSIFIIVTITGVMIANYPESSIKITLANLNNKVALLIREAQVRGSAIDSNNSTLAVESPVSGYGIYFNLSTPESIILFADSVDGSIPKPYGLTVGDGLYQTTPTNELYSTTVFPSGYILSKICVGSSYPYTCNNQINPPINNLTISFTRPSPQPNIYINNDRTTSYSSACVELHSPRYPGPGHIRSITIYTSGMIRKNLTSCN